MKKIFTSLLLSVLCVIAVNAQDYTVEPANGSVVEQLTDIIITWEGATKIDVKIAVEKIFGVEVENVNTMNYMGKTKRMGVHIGKRADWKKAIVTLKADSKGIEFFESML